jgi:hypothetical protein
MEGLTLTLGSDAHIDRVMSRGEQLQRYYNVLFRHNGVLSHPETKNILGFDRSGAPTIHEPSGLCSFRLHCARC